MNYHQFIIDNHPAMGGASTEYHHGDIPDFRLAIRDFNTYFRKAIDYLVARTGVQVPVGRILAQFISFQKTQLSRYPYQQTSAVATAPRSAPVLVRHLLFRPFDCFGSKYFV